MSSPKKFSKSLTKQQSNNNSFYNISYNTKNFNTDRLKTQIIDLNKNLKSNYDENNYMNRPIINFIPKMPLYNFDKKELINPSKMNYVVPIMPPPSHRIKRSFRETNYTNPFMKPELSDEIAYFEKGLFTYLRRKKFEKKK